jgi:hypothetical protein
MPSYLFSSESVTEGHPDKLCDAVSDGVLDAILADDPGARVACETFTKTGFVLVAGEITTSTYVDIPTIVRASYIGIDPRLVQAAGRSVFAHLEDLVARKVVATDGEPSVEGTYRLAGPLA